MPKYEQFRNADTGANSAIIESSEQMNGIKAVNGGSSIASNTKSLTTGVSTLNSITRTSNDRSPTSTEDISDITLDGEVTINTGKEPGSAEDGMQHEPLLSRRQKVLFVVEHLLFRLFSVLLILTDLTLLITELWIESSLDHQAHIVFDVLSMMFMTYFVFEVSLRIYAKT